MGHVDNIIEPLKIIFTSAHKLFSSSQAPVKILHMFLCNINVIHGCGTKNLIMNGNKFIDVVYCFHSRASARKIFPFTTKYIQ